VTLTEEYTFMLNDTGVVLNTDSTLLPFVDINKVSGMDNAEYRETQRDHEGTDGGFMDAEFEKGRTVLLEGELYADTANMEAYLDSLKENWAPSSTPIPLYLKVPGRAERVMFVKPLGCRYDWESIRRFGSSRVQFKAFAEDPRIYTSELITTIINYGGDAGTGFAFNLGFDFGFGPAVAPTGANVNNSGNRPTPAIMTIVGPVTSPAIVNDTAGLTLAFNITLAATDSLVIDLANRTVLLNGINRRGTLLQPNWFFLAKGDNFIRFGGGAGTGSYLTIQHRAAWR
jgi:hypothetical protein